MHGSCSAPLTLFHAQALLQQLAAKFAGTKFVSIVYNNCIPDYPEAALPCVLVYAQGDIVKQMVGLQE